MKKIQYEIWKDIKGYEGLYQVSNYGNVKSLERWVSNGKGLMLKKERILKNSLMKNGYYRVTLSKNNTGKNYKTHLLVWEHFGYGERDGHKLCVDHINNNPLDNRIDNLQLLTNRENSSKDKWRKKYTSNYVGVFWNKNIGKWISSIYIKGKTIYLGCFDNEYDAHVAYQSKKNEIKKKK